MNKFVKIPAEAIGELHPLFRPLLWVSAAKSDDDTRFILNHLLVERDGLKCNVVATDGRRLHVAEFDPGMFDDDIDMLEQGLYEVIAKSSKFIIVSKSDVEGTYPDWRKIFPQTFPPHRNEAITAKSISLLGIRTGVLLANDFVLDAIGFGCGFKKDSSVLVDFGFNEEGARTGFQIRHEIGRAVVMPMRIDDHITKPVEEPPTEAQLTPDLPEVAAHLQSMQKQCAKDGSTVTIKTGDAEVTISPEGVSATRKPAAKKAPANKAAKKSPKKK